MYASSVCNTFETTRNMSDSREFIFPQSKNEEQQPPPQEGQQPNPKPNLKPVERETPPLSYKSLLSFLEVDNSCLSPWSYDPNTLKGDSSKTGLEEPQTGSKELLYWKFEPGSFFTHEVLDMKPQVPKNSHDP